VVTVAAPPVAVTPVSDGIEKNVPSQATGAAAVMVASFVSVTLSVPLAATVSALLSVCELPLVPVAKFQATSLVVLEQPDCGVPSAAEVKPAA
jgi:methylglyoxal synthase